MPNSPAVAANGWNMANAPGAPGQFDCKNVGAGAHSVTSPGNDCQPIGAAVFPLQVTVPVDQHLRANAGRQLDLPKLLQIVVENVLEVNTMLLAREPDPWKQLQL
ncbi:MAG: hypothetical protein BIFFINMI_00921 [Phycisphaerae bacterium]|nr:hypothetical protein [Phycisphaerae bacterium]